MSETPDPLPEVIAGTIIDQRFKVEAALPESFGVGAFAAKDEETGTPCVAFAISQVEKPAIDALRKINHAHLAKVLAVQEVPGGALVVAERIDGESLAERLDAIGKKEVVDAVRSALRLADALSVAHQAGAYHGRVHPGVVIVEPKGRPGPVLALAGRTDPDSFYRSPDRGQQGPSEHDDAWAIGALLVKMLTGNDPPTDGFESEADLEKHGVVGAPLQSALFRSLHTDPAERNEGLRPLKRDLARWFVDHAGEEPFSAHAMSSSPPPLPPTSGAPPVVTHSPTSRATPPKKNRLPVFAVGGLVLGLGAAWAASAMLSEPESPQQAPAASATSAPSSAPAASAADAIDLGEVDIEGESETNTASNNKLSACVASYLPKKSFDTSPDLAWVCSVDSPRQGADKLRGAIVANSPGGQVSHAMQLFSRMGWYDLVAFSVVRAGCCPEAPPLKLSDPSESCERLDTIASSIGRQVVDGQDFSGNLEKFTEAARCEAKAGAGAKFKKPEPPGGGEQEAFVEYTKELK